MAAKGRQEVGGWGDIFGMLRVQMYRDHDTDCELSMTMSHISQ